MSPTAISLGEMMLAALQEIRLNPPPPLTEGQVPTTLQQVANGVVCPEGLRAWWESRQR